MAVAILMHEDISSGKSPGLCPELGVEVCEDMLLTRRSQGCQPLATNWARPQALTYEKAVTTP